MSNQEEISVFNPNNKPKVQKWLNDISKFNSLNAKNKPAEYDRLNILYQTNIRNMIDKNAPVKTMGRVNSAFSNLTRKYKNKNKKNGGKRKSMRR
jgi:hypothetical protein